MFSQSYINISWRMGTIFFTSRRYLLKRCVSDSTRIESSQTRSPCNTLRQRLFTSPCNHQFQLIPRHRPRIIHRQQLHLTKQRWSSIWWPIKCTKTRYLWRSYSAKPPWRSLKKPFYQTFNIQHPPFPKGYGTPTTKLIFLAQVENDKAKSYYASIPDWLETMSMTKQLIVAISA